MTTGEAAFAVWAPDGDFWSQWAKPVVFANAPALINDAVLTLPSLDNLPLPGPFDPAAIVVDLPGDQSVLMGLALAARGYRPVPLFNGTSGPNAVIPVEPIETALGSGAEVLKRTTLSPEARPAFLLDANRTLVGGAGPGQYDNRWIILPQDVPSATTLRSRGITQVTVVRRSAPVPDQDLSVVLRHWQEGGIAIRGVTTETGAADESLSLALPVSMRAIWYAAIALLGLRRNSVGGFGAVVPEQTQRSGFDG
jgi:hypothetical protein